MVLFEGIWGIFGIIIEVGNLARTKALKNFRLIEITFVNMEALDEVV